jgi:hypothetical protein
MAQAIARTGEISPEVCRSTARARFSMEKMIKQYIEAYEALSQSRSDYSVLGAA